MEGNRHAAPRPPLPSEKMDKMAEIMRLAAKRYSTGVYDKRLIGGNCGRGFIGGRHGNLLLWAIYTCYSLAALSYKLL
jgi:hypothetical protein